MEILKFVAHSKTVINIATKHGWLPGARYTNMRDVRDVEFANIGFLDIDWKNYDFAKHLEHAARNNPLLTIARDVESINDLDEILFEANKLSKYSKWVVIVPKDTRLNGCVEDLIPKNYLLGYSVPTKYGGTKVDIKSFKRPVHLLGGRPDTQRQLAKYLDVVSIDCNRFTYDAKFGDFFDGETFRPHPQGGYKRCLEESINNINKLWLGYDTSESVNELLRSVV